MHFGLGAYSLRYSSLDESDFHARSCPRSLSAGNPYAVLSSTPGNKSPILRTVSKSIVLLRIGHCDFVGLNDVA
jgi:hypothetical protein